MSQAVNIRRITRFRPSINTKFHIDYDWWQQSGRDFRLYLRATDYFDFIILIMLAMGAIFQMPAITYVLARIGLVTAALLVRVWKTALIVILVAAAVLSPTSDVPNMMLFAAPMIVLYLVSIFVAWVFAKPRVVE